MKEDLFGHLCKFQAISRHQFELPKLTQITCRNQRLNFLNFVLIHKIILIITEHLFVIHGDLSSFN